MFLTAWRRADLSSDEVGEGLPLRRFTIQVYGTEMIRRVFITRLARKQLQKTPRHVVVKLLAWVRSVEEQGLSEVRKIPGFHDEPLRGERQGQRSIRLNRSYRAIYRLLEDDAIEFVSIEEVTKHEY